MKLTELIFSPDYLLNSSFLILLFGPIYIFILAMLYKRKKITVFKSLGLLSLFVYLYNLLSLTLFPINIYSHSNEIHKYAFGKVLFVNVNVFDMLNYGKFQIIGNFILLLPLSILVAYLFPRLNKFKPNVILGLTTTLSIETIQLIMNYFYLGRRSFDVNDLILNSLGYICGFAIYKITKPLFKTEKDLLKIY